MNNPSKRAPLQSERSFDSSNGRPTKYFKLDRTYSDVVEDELYDPQPSARDIPQSGSKDKPHQARTERIQNVYPQLFDPAVSHPSDTVPRTDHYWPGMESSIRFDREQNSDIRANPSIIADKKQKIKQQPEQSTVSPKEAFLDYSENADRDLKGLISIHSPTEQQQQQQESHLRVDSAATSRARRKSSIPAMQAHYCEMATPKTITPVRAHENMSPRPVARVHPIAPVAVSEGPSQAQAHDNAVANARFRALYKEESTNSNLSGGSDLHSPPSGSDMDHPSSQATTVPPARDSSPPSLPVLSCSECHETFEKPAALELHARIHARPPPPRRRDTDPSFSEEEEEEADTGDDYHEDKVARSRTSGGNHGSATTAAAAAAANGANGPHRCDWIIPSTGHVCGTIFSRPYDLVRHQDTIHRAKKLEFRCEICFAANIKKIFSRNDALVRHMRHVHKKDPPKRT